MSEPRQCYQHRCGSNHVHDFMGVAAMADASVAVKTCRACGVLFDTRNCRACQRASSKQWRENNPEKAKAAIAAWRLAHPERARQWTRKYREANPDKAKGSAAKWRSANKDHKAAYRNSNIDSSRLAISTWWSSHPELKRVYKQNRRDRKRQNGGRLSKDVVIKLFELQRGKCACCGEPLGDRYHLDHIVPLKRGGKNIDSNVQLLTQRCNNQKHTKDPIDFMQERGFLL